MSTAITRPKIKNPFRPGAGQMPPYLAGRKEESKQFERLLEQEIILENLVLTGLRGVGKTVLLQSFKPLALEAGWWWTETDMGEASTRTEENLAIRLLTDLAVVTCSFTITTKQRIKIGFCGEIEAENTPINHNFLKSLYDSMPGLVLDKIKGVLETVWPIIKTAGRRGIIFAYDEAQNLADHAAKDQFPLSLLIDLFQSLQRKHLPYMLVLTGLPTLFPKLVEARTFTERMCRVVSLGSLSEEETMLAIKKPIEGDELHFNFSDESTCLIWQATRGYPYFVQYFCREVFDVWVQAVNDDKEPHPIPIEEIMRKLDSDFFMGRWAKATDRQRELLGVIAFLPNAGQEFTVQEIVADSRNRALEKPFGSSHVNQMLLSLSNAGLVYKNRYGKYSLAVPLLDDFIRRQV